MTSVQDMILSEVKKISKKTDENTQAISDLKVEIVTERTNCKLSHNKELNKIKMSMVRIIIMLVLSGIIGGSTGKVVSALVK